MITKVTEVRGVPTLAGRRFEKHKILQILVNLLHNGALAAKEMGGSLAVHSDGPGQGAAFTL